MMRRVEEHRVKSQAGYQLCFSFAGEESRAARNRKIDATPTKGFEPTTLSVRTSALLAD